MNSTEWQQAKLDDIPSQHGAEFWREWTDDPAFGSRWHSVRHHFGLTSIGINANGGDAGDQIVVEHDEQEDANQDEVYFVVRGRARFVLDGTEIEAGPGELVCVGGAVTRAAWAVESPTQLLMIGGTPGGAYAVPGWDGG